MKFSDVPTVDLDYSTHLDRSVLVDFEDFVVFVLGLAILEIT